ncbi:TauD/TfdA family dioxygenase [Amycolatopsis tolypomycina]|uniref:TauD/TfdA family dioxygenase n=1 Tax=Amycolatopsis tolypomycina TaxID=208445 RepID=UPI00339DD1FC
MNGELTATSGGRPVLKNVPSFSELGTTPPVSVSSFELLTSAQCEEIASRYHRSGLAIVQAAAGVSSEKSLLVLAGKLGLGDPFVPPVYAGSASIGQVGLSRMSVSAGPGGESQHPSFQTTNKQDTHTDGTLQRIGEVKTSALLCLGAAASGGETFFFNSAGAYAKLAGEDPAAARALLMPDVLVRSANMPGIDASVSGPAFSILDEGLVTRFSLSSTDTWHVSDDATGTDLLRGIKFLLDLRLQESECYWETVLEPGQAVIFANDRISHGRKSYENTPGSPREILRGLFTKRPEPGGAR